MSKKDVREMNVYVVCPDCQGVGKLKAFFGIDLSPEYYRKIATGVADREVVCERCAGQGRTSIEWSHWLSDGSFVRMTRRLQGKSLGEYADEFDISPSDLSRYERGIEEMPGELFKRLSSKNKLREGA